MQEDAPVRVVTLTATNHELPVLDRNRQILFRKTRHSERDTIRMIGGLFDIIGRVAFIAGFGRTLQQAFQLLEAQHMRV